VRITALVESPDHVCCRYRVEAFRGHLEQAGHRLALRPWPRSCWSRLRLGRVLERTDAVILQRRLLPLWQLYLLRREMPLLVYDFDDAVFLRDSYAARGLASLRRLQRFVATIESADLVVAGNDYLAQQAARWTRPERVCVVPTCTDPARYPLARHRATGATLAWIGSSSTLQGLERIRPLLEAIGQRVPGLRLKIICDRFLQLRQVPVMACAWSEATEAAELADCDVGISWLPDDDWSRGKCGLKVLQYMAAGLPVVANPVGVQAEMVRHGVTGFLAQTASQWLEAVARLAADPALRRALGQAGRQRVEAEYSVAAGAQRWLGILDRLGKRRAAA
jgi:glycosyltransferase involved in cell wall biosynthesis